MKYTSTDTEHIVKEAYRLNQLFHICVHMEQAHLLSVKTMEHYKRAYGKANETALAMIQRGVINLSSTFKSDPTIPLGPSDITERSPEFSAINNQTHLNFLNRTKPKIGLVTGLEADTCVPATIEHMKRMGITPVMIVDAIDFPHKKALDGDLATEFSYATMFPHIPFFELYTNDFHAKDDLNDSAVEAPLVQSFIQQRSISVMLISGYAIGECIDAAVKSALEQGIIPILIADATDTVAEPASAAQKDKDYYIQLFESLVDGNVHVAHVDDVQDWVAELYTDDYMHS
jgi:nicotinamidase-related amidase